MKRVRVLVVDDSPTMRSLISATLRRDPLIDVVGGAGDPIEAREAIKALSPDVITLDVEMPRMDGIEFLEKLMRLRPMPVIMVSTLTHEGAAVTLEALALGAFDCVAKPDFDDLAEKVRSAAVSSVRASADRRGSAPPLADYRPGAKTIAIGSSTGGVEALLTMLASFPKNCPPTLITQHMPATFTASFADRLNRSIAPSVKEAADGDPIEVGQIYIAPGGARHLEVQGGLKPRCRLVEGPTVNGHRPSVDVLFQSVRRTFGSRAAGVILTGMGRDGAEGLKALREAGARTLGQDAASSVVYGMPKAAFEIGAVETQFSLSRIGPAVLDICSMQSGRIH